ncbi:MAG: hypothetical protein K1X94_02050 [Sandaracinaceae bacterium]|nr:hypothetical protein [Sandaracinaceae bacterium]
MTTTDPLALRAARSWTGDPLVRQRSLARLREALVEEGRLLWAPCVAWLGDDLGSLVFEACAAADLATRALGRRSVAEDALCSLLDVLDETSELRTRAANHPPFLRELLALALEHRLRARCASVPLPPVVHLATAAAIAEVPPSPRPLESVVRARLGSGSREEASTPESRRE